MGMALAAIAEDSYDPIRDDGKIGVRFIKQLGHGVLLEMIGRFAV
jgi:hypothetical protein